MLCVIKIFGLHNLGHWSRQNSQKQTIGIRAIMFRQIQYKPIKTSPVQPKFRREQKS